MTSAVTGGAHDRGEVEPPRFECEPDAERQLVIDTFASFFTKQSPLVRVRAAASTLGFDADLWAEFVAIGGDRIATAESGGSTLDAVVVGFEAGRHLAPIPYADVAPAIRFAETSGLVLHEFSRPTVVELAAMQDEVSALVPAGAAVDTLIVVRGGQVHTIALPPGDPRVVPVQNLGPIPMAQVRLRLPEAVWLVPVTAGALEDWRADRRVLRAAVMLGAAEQAMDHVVEHVRHRFQFGRPIGSFQAIQHRLATCATKLRAARLLTIRAASWQMGDPSRARYAYLAARAASDAASLTVRECLQFFGGYGFTLEYDIQLYLRIATAWCVVAKDESPLAEHDLMSLVG